MRLGPDHRTIPAKIFVENLNCPDLTASFLAGAKDLWRIQKTACLLLPPLLYLGSSGQFPEWLTFDVSDPKVLRGGSRGDSFKASGDLLSPSMGSLGALPAQPKMHFVFGQDTSGPLEFSLVLHLGTTPWVMALMTSCPDSGVFFWTLDPPLSILGTTCARKES